MILLVFFLLFGTSMDICGQTPPPDDIPVLPPPLIPKSPTDSPTIRSFYTSDTLMVSITDYFGHVEVVIEEENAEEGVIFICQTVMSGYINGYAVLTADIHTLPSADYILRIRLGDDYEYIGYFSK